MRVTWYSHSCFMIEAGPYRLLTDPYLTDNPHAAVSAADVRCTHILCSHAHLDHLGDTVQIATRNDALVIAPYEIAEYISAQGVRAEDPMPGGRLRTDFGEIKATPAIHSCSLEQDHGRNIALGVACGFVFSMEGKRIYFAGDTALFSDMRLIGRPALDVAFLPIGDHYTMGISDAVLALEYLCPRVCIPMHYDTNKKIMVDPQEFVDAAAIAGHRVVVPRTGETMEV